MSQYLRRKDRIVVLGFMSHFPVPGVAWQTVHYLIGFQRLGYDVYYVEAHGCTPSKLMQTDTDDGPVRAAEYIEGIMRRFGLENRWAYHALYHKHRESIDYLAPHCAFFSYGENLGNPDCLVPLADQFKFRPTRQPVI